METKLTPPDAGVKQGAKTHFNYKKWLLTIFLVAFIQLLVMLGIFSRPEMALYDSWFRLKGPQNPGEQVVVVAIDDASVNRIGPLAWPRTVHAELLKKLSQAKVVGFDLTFSSEKDAQEDQAFADAIAQHKHVVLASKATFEKDQAGELSETMELPLRKLMKGVAGVGFVNTPQDADQVVRRMSTVDVNINPKIPFPSFSLATYMEAEDIKYKEIKLTPGYLVVKDQKIPINEMNQAMPTFYGPTETFKTISYADIIEGDVSPDYFKDKIVLIGAATAEDHDVYATPYSTTNMVKTGSRAAPGVEIHANTVQSYLNASWYRQVDKGYNFLFLLVMAILTTLAVAGRGPWIGLLGTMGVAAVTIATVFYLWKAHWWLNIAAPLAIIVLVYAVVTSTDFILAEMQRRKTKAMFSRYVSPDVVDELMANPDQMSLGGKKQVVTIMFTDIRGFTAFSENKDPVDVISRLNEYLTAQTDAILKHGGTLDKYMGDGVMAFFGAPVYYEDHVERAVRVARDIQERVAELNIKWAETGDLPLLIAVGINTGPVVVGNVGSPERMDYTLIGEDANLASRVEALTKLFETLVLVSERSYNLLPEGELKDSLSYVGEELVKGFTNPIKVYTFKDMNLHFEKSKDKGFK